MKLSISELKRFATEYVKETEVANDGAYKASTDNVLNLLDKIGKQITISNNYSDKLPELDGEELEYGRQVEEFFIDLPTILGDAIKNKDISDEEAKAYAEGALKPYLPDVEDVCYSYTLGKRVIPTTISGNNVERAALNAENAGSFLADITSKLAAAESLYKYANKKQLLGIVAKAAIGADLATTVEGGTDTTTAGENFIEAVKAAVEEASFAHEGGLNKALIGATDESNLMLIVKKGTLPSLDVKVWSGAFNLDKASFPNITIKVVEDFGDADNVKAMLIDKRGVRLHKSYGAVKTQENAYYDSVNIFNHFEYTAFYSKYTYVRVFR